MLLTERDSAMLSTKELPSSDVALADEGTNRVGTEGTSCSAAAVIGCIVDVLMVCTDGVLKVDVTLCRVIGVGRCLEMDLLAIRSLFHSANASKALWRCHLLQCE